MYRHNGEITTLPLTKEDNEKVARLNREIEGLRANIAALRDEESILWRNVNDLQRNIVMPDEILELEDYTDKIQAYLQSHGFAFVNDDNLRLLNTKRGLLKNWSLEQRILTWSSVSPRIYNDAENGLLKAMYTDFDDNIKVCGHLPNDPHVLKYVGDYTSSHVIAMDSKTMIAKLDIRKKYRSYKGETIYLEFICDVHNKPKSAEDIFLSDNNQVFSIYRHPNSKTLYNSKTNMTLDLLDLRDFKLYFHPKYTDDMKNAFYKELTSKIYKQSLKGV